MQVQTSVYRTASGWPQPLPAQLDGPQTLILAFGARALETDPRPFEQLREAFPRALIAGCSTAGEINGSQVLDDSLSIVVAQFEHTRLRLASHEVTDHEQASADAGKDVAAQLAGEGLRALFVLSDGVVINGTPLVAAMVANLPGDVSITGGLAGDGDRFARTWVLVDGKPCHHHVTAIGFYGSRLLVASGCEGGWKDFGPERRVTRSSGNVLYELDGKPALDLYKTYLGALASGLPGTALLFPLSIKPANSTSPALVRTILGIDEAEHSMTFAGDIPQGFSARLMRSSNDNLISSATSLAARAAADMPSKTPVLAVSVSCVGRRLALGERVDEEIEPVLADLPEGAAHVGFYSYGEIAASTEGGCSELHNQTMTITIFGES